MYIRQSVGADLPRIMEIYAHARAFMTEHGNPRQWARQNWPPQSLIEEDIRIGHSYVCLSGDTIVGTFYYDYGTAIDSTYDVIEDGAWIGNETYGVVHRIASDNSQKGIGSACINWAFEQCHHLRIDTHTDNTVMQNFLKKLGFTQCGIIHVKEDNDPRLAYEKLAETP